MLLGERRACCRRWICLCFATVGIGSGVGVRCGVVNHVLDQRVSMRRWLEPRAAAACRQDDCDHRAALTLRVCTRCIYRSGDSVGPWPSTRLTAVLTFVSLIGYAVVYTDLPETGNAAKHRDRWCRRCRAATYSAGLPSTTKSVQAALLLLFLIVFLVDPAPFLGLWPSPARMSTLR